MANTDTDYNKIVDEYLSTNSTKVLGNYLPEHARYIISSFIKNANYSIDILSGECNDIFYDNNKIWQILKNSAKKIAQNNGYIRIITADGVVCKKLKSIIDEINSENKKVFAYYRPALYEGKKKLNHFLIVDEMRYRLEDVHEKKHNGIPDVVKAEVCCNGTKKAEELKSFFDGIWKFLEPQNNEVVNANNRA